MHTGAPPSFQVHQLGANKLDRREFISDTFNKLASRLNEL